METWFVLYEWTEGEDRMINVCRSTDDKPLTVFDRIADLESCVSLFEIRRFAEQVPVEIRQDERFTLAVAKRIAAIKGRKAAA